MSLKIHVIKATANPTLAPTEAGQHWINTSNGNHYLAVGTSVVGDWILTTSSTNVAVSGTDTTPGFLSDKLIADVGTNSSAALESSIVNGGGDEDQRIRFDATKITFQNNSATDNTTATTTSTTDVLLTSMTLTPGAGTYVATFNASTSNTNTGDEQNFFSIYVNGVQNANTLRRSGGSGGHRRGVTIITIISVAAAQAVEVRWRVTANTGSTYERTFNLVRIGV